MTTQYIYDLVDTWNDGATTFTAIKMNVTDTTSNAASMLALFQLGSATRFSVRKDGRMFVGNADNFGNLITESGEFIGYYAGQSRAKLSLQAVNGFDAQFTLISGGVFALTGTGNVFMHNPAANNLRLGRENAASPAAQTLSVQSVVAGTTNTAGAALTITGSQGTGTGAGGSIIFQVAPLGLTGAAQNTLVDAWSISGAGHFLAGTDNTYDIGASSATRPRSVFITDTFRITNTTAGNSTFSFAMSGVEGQIVASGGAVLLSSSGTASLRVSGGTTPTVQFGGTSSSFPALKRSTTFLQVRLADDSAFAPVQGKLTTDTAYTAGAIVATGYLTLYDSTGTAYRVPCVV